METDEMELTDKHLRYWRKNLRMTALLLLIWFMVTFGVSYYARELNFTFFGWPFSFWMGAQGALVVYVVIVGFYAWYMGRLDVEYGLEERED
jgi:putative solute:sodium symporter small subunit